MKEEEEAEETGGKNPWRQALVEAEELRERLESECWRRLAIARAGN
jgi:hypothetical protein